MKIEILVGSNYPDGDEEVRVESGDVVDVPDKIAKSLIKNNAAVKFDSKKKSTTKKKRARNEDGSFKPDDPTTPENEAWEESE
jgi:hypothetical protein|tara:strand:+ start:2797 stop:3045 length:249 start_codon:yes stop_codon:yes gene_type:complete